MRSSIFSFVAPTNHHRWSDRLPDAASPHQPEIVAVISGTFRLGMGEEASPEVATVLDPGGFFVYPLGIVHYAYAGGETVLQLNKQRPGRTPTSSTTVTFPGCDIRQDRASRRSCWASAATMIVRYSAAVRQHENRSKGRIGPSFRPSRRRLG